MLENSFIATSGEQEMKKSKLLELFEKHIINPLKGALSKSKKIKCVDCIVRNEKGQVLLLQRQYQDDFEPGKWGFPGGHVDEGEDCLTAAKRELYEETGLRAEVRFIETKENPDCIIEYYEAIIYLDQKDQLLESTLILDIEEHRGWEWCNLEMIKDYSLIKDLGSYIDELLSKLTPITIVESRFTNPEEAIAVSGNDGSLDIHWDIIQIAFDEGQITEEEFMKAREQYFEIKKGEEYLNQHDEALEIIIKAFDDELINEQQYLGAIEKGGKRAVIGEKRLFAGREYIKTVSGWQFHGKGTGAKAQEHAKKAQAHNEEHGGHFKKKEEESTHIAGHEFKGPTEHGFKGVEEHLQSKKIVNEDSSKKEKGETSKEVKDTHKERGFDESKGDVDVTGQSEKIPSGNEKKTMESKTKGLFNEVTKNIGGVDTSKRKEAENIVADGSLDGSWEEKEIPLKDIVFTQDYIEDKKVKKIKIKEEALPDAALIDGKYHITDGHHRASKAILDGQKSIKVIAYKKKEDNVKEEDEKKSAKDNKPKEIKRPTAQEWDKAPSLGEGYEGEVRDFGTFAVKKWNAMNASDAKEKIQELIKKPDNDYIQFYDMWEDGDHTYVSMQKLTQEELDVTSKDEGKAYNEAQKIAGENWSEEFADAGYGNKPMPTKLKKLIESNEYLSFQWKMMKKGVGDLIGENIAKVNGEYKLFDSW